MQTIHSIAKYVMAHRRMHMLSQLSVRSRMPDTYSATECAVCILDVGCAQLL